MKRGREILQQAAAVILLTAGAAGLRHLFGPHVGSRISFLLYLLAVAAAAQIAGTTAGVIVTGFGIILIGRATPASDLYMRTALVIFGVVGCALSIFGGWRKHVENKRQRIQYNLETAQQIANIGSWESERGGPLWWSDETYRIFGVAAGTKVSRQDFYDLVHPEDRTRVVEAVQQAVESQSDYDVEHRIVRKSDGEVRYVHQRAKVPAGGKARLIGSVQDTTETKRVLRALEDAQERLALKHEVARIGTFEWFVQEGYVEWSPEMERVYGREAPHHRLTLEQWKSCLHPDDVDEVVAVLEQAPGARLPVSDHTFRIVRPDGEVRWLHSRRKYQYDAQGKPVHVIGVNIDITELKQGEMAQQILGGLLQVCSACRRIRDANTEEWYSMEGYLRRHSTAKFSHGMCEDCGRQWYPEGSAGKEG